MCSIISDGTDKVLLFYYIAPGKEVNWYQYYTSDMTWLGNELPPSCVWNKHFLPLTYWSIIQHQYIYILIYLPLWQSSHCRPILLGRHAHWPVFWLHARFSVDSWSPSWVPVGSQSQEIHPVSYSKLRPHVFPRHWLQLEPCTFDLQTQSPVSCKSKKKSVKRPKFCKTV